VTAARAERRAAARPARESRHRSREAALQMLYQWEVGRVSMADVARTFWPLAEVDAKADGERQAFATRLAEGVAASIDDIDPMIVEAAEHWRIERLNVLDRLILRLAIYELLHEPETPAKVIINEALELARTFSGDEAVRFVNGVLDAVRRKLQRS
jgi:N utilization substance protein B